MDQKIEAATPKSTPTTTTTTTSKQSLTNVFENLPTRQAPKPVAAAIRNSPNRSTPPPPPPPQQQSSEEFANRCRATATNLLKNVASASKIELDGVLFGDYARDAMIATKDVIALTDESTNKAAATDELREAANKVRDSVIAFVKEAKADLGDGNALNASNENVSPCVRDVALSTKSWLTLVIPPTSTTTVTKKDEPV